MICPKCKENEIFCIVLETEKTYSDNIVKYSVDEDGDMDECLDTLESGVDSETEIVDNHIQHYECPLCGDISKEEFESLVRPPVPIPKRELSEFDEVL